MSNLRRTSTIALILTCVAGAAYGQRQGVGKQDYAVVPLDLSTIPAISLPADAGVGIINLVGEDVRGAMAGSPGDGSESVLVDRRIGARASRAGGAVISSRRGALQCTAANRRSEPSGFVGPDSRLCRL